MALVNGTNYDHIDLYAADGDVTRHKLQDTAGRALVAPAEAGSTASAAHTAGAYFIYGGALYRATADIASGGSIVVSGSGQNCEAVTVGGELKRNQAEMNAAKAPVIIPTAAVSFPDGADGLPLKSCRVEIRPVQSGSGDPSPTNVRTISGWTGATVDKTKKNLIKFPYCNASGTSQGVTATVYDDGSIKLNGTVTGDAYYFGLSDSSSALVCPPGTYTLKKPTSGNSVALIGVKNGADYLADAVTADATFTLTEAAALHFYLRIDVGTVLDNVMVYPQLEIGSSSTAWEPYAGETYSVFFPAEAGTVYFGEVDPVAGTLTVSGAIADMGSLSWYMAQDASFFATDSLAGVILPHPDNGAAPSLLATIYKTTALSVDFDDCTAGITQTGAQIRVHDSRYSTAEAQAAGITGQYVCYELATPTVYRMTPMEIVSFLGHNCILANTGGVTVQYCADTKLYIDNLTRTDEDDMIANGNIASGKYFTVGNRLFLSTASIAAGDPITPGTNCRETSLADALNALNA